MAQKWDSHSLQQALVSIVKPEQVLTDPVDLACYSYDSGLFSALNYYKPDGVILVRGLEDVTKVIKWARTEKVPIIPRGASTGQAGGTLAASGGIVLDLSTWNKIESIEPENRMVFCRPGITHAKLNQALEPYGLHLPPDPSSGDGCTIGGMAANNSSGVRSLKYGPMNHYVLGLEIVTGSGEVIYTGGAAGKVLKSVSGLNLNSLFVGSEGTLGIITGVWLMVVQRPAARAAVLMVFDNAENALAASKEIQRRGVIPAAMEFVYCAPEATKAAEEFHHGLYVPDAEIEIICEVDGNQASVAWEYAQVQEVAKEYARAWHGADDWHGIKELWEANDAIETFSSKIREGAKRTSAGEDVCVKLEFLPMVLREMQNITRKNGIGIVNFGHWAQGNIHSGLLVHIEDPREVEAAVKTADEIHRLVLEVGGATTAEHGVGLVRASYMEEEHGASLAWMAQVKKALDPDNILNPGKIWPQMKTAR